MVVEKKEKQKDKKWARYRDLVLNFISETTKLPWEESSIDIITVPRGKRGIPRPTEDGSTNLDQSLITYFIHPEDINVYFQVRKKPEVIPAPEERFVDIITHELLHRIQMQPTNIRRVMPPIAKAMGVSLS